MDPRGPRFARPAVVAGPVTRLPSGRTTLSLFLLLALAISLLVALPGGRWNSDDAIPVLMSNDGTRGLFDLYYWGQDRLGGWAWMLAAQVHRVSGFDWTPERLKLLHVLFALLGGLVFPWRLGSAGWIAASAWVLAATLLWRLPELHLALGQPYGAQGVLVVLALACLLAPDATRRTLVAAAGLSFMANWESPASGPMLLGAVIAAVPFERGIALRRRLPQLVLPILAGAAAELALRGLYQASNRRAYGQPFRRSPGLDPGYFAENSLAVMSAVLQDGWVASTTVVALLATLTVLVRQPAQPATRDVARWMAALTGAAAANAATLVLFRHMRVSLYDDRYLMPSYLFFAVAAALALLLAVLRTRPGIAVAAPVSVLLLAWPIGSLLRTPPEDEARDERAALEVLRQGGAELLLGHYWDVYAVTGLDPSRSLEGLVIEGEWNRTPWVTPLLARRPNTWIISRPPDASIPASAISPVLIEYGHVVVVDVAAARVAGGAYLAPVRFADEARLLAREAAGFPCQGGAVSLGARIAAGELWVRSDGAAPGLRLAGTAPDGGRSMAPSGVYPRHARFDVPLALEAPVLQLPAGGQCRVRAAAWLPARGSS